MKLNIEECSNGLENYKTDGLVLFQQLEIKRSQLKFFITGLP